MAVRCCARNEVRSVPGPCLSRHKLWVVHSRSPPSHHPTPKYGQSRPERITSGSCEIAVVAAPDRSWPPSGSPFKQRVDGSSPSRPIFRKRAERRRYDVSSRAGARRSPYRRCMKSRRLVTTLVGCARGTMSATTSDRTNVASSTPAILDPRARREPVGPELMSRSFSPPCL
jgi:hypothetical protein